MENIYGQIQRAQTLDTKQTELLLNILGEIAGEFEGLLLERKKIMKIMCSLNDNRDLLLNFWTHLMEIAERENNFEGMEKILKTIFSWKDLKIQILAQPRLIFNILKYFKVENLSEISTNILSSILKNSNYSRFIEASNLEQARKRYTKMRPHIDQILSTNLAQLPTNETFENAEIDVDEL